jgi:two-component system uhpT operon response regulator UhpA
MAGARSVELAVEAPLLREGLRRLLRRRGVTVRQGAPVVVADAGGLDKAASDGRLVVALGTGRADADLSLLARGAIAVVSACDPDLLARAVAAASLGLAVLPEAVLALLRERSRAARRAVRRQRVAELLVEGCTVREMAARLGVSPATVKLDLRAIYRDLGACRKAEAAARLAAVMKEEEKEEAVVLGEQP